MTISAVLDWALRPQCSACARVLAPTEGPLCPPCGATIEELGDACPACAEPMERGALCRRCTRTPLPLDRIVAPWRFGGQLAIAIRRLKFSHRMHVARDLAPLWAPLIAAAAGDDGVVVPVPLHWRRRLVRGFDQTWLLAIHACAFAQLAPPIAALRRTRYTPPQSVLGASERRDNLRGAFALRRPLASRIAGATVVLVDDVVTTGSTLAAAARPLLAAGAAQVIGVALARATS